jgi:hypothetical protein
MELSMAAPRFVVLAVSNETTIVLALLVGFLLLIAGLLLLLLPHAERRSRNPPRLRHSREAPSVLPGYRIRSEQARIPRRFLSVPHIAVLAPRQAHQSSPPAAAAATKEPSTAEREPSDALADDPTLVRPPLAAASQDRTLPETQPPGAIDQATIITLDHPVSTTPPAGDALKKPGRITRPLPETLAEAANPRPPAVPWQPEDLRFAEMYNAVIQGRIVELEAIRQVIAEFEAVATAPERLGRFSWNILDALRQLRAHLEQLAAQPDESAPQSGEASQAVPQPITIPTAGTSPAISEPDVVPADDTSPTLEDASEGASTPAPAGAEPDTRAQTPIRKAQLSSLFSEPPAERPFRKDAQPLPLPPPEPQPPQSAARRAHLVGFPSPLAQMGSPAMQQKPEEHTVQSPGTASLGPLPPGGAENLHQSETTQAVRPEASPRRQSHLSQPLSQAEATSVPPLLRVVCFGTVDILASGKSLSPLDSRFRSSREFELMAFLAHSAATRRQAFVDRSTITEALLPEETEDDLADESSEEGEETTINHRSPLGGWKYRLCRRLRSQGIPDHAWLESRADGALRLRSEVQIDLIDFLQASSHLRRARDQMRRPDGKLPKRDEVLEWLQHLWHLYRDRGEFAEQFQLQEWTQEPRRRYRSIYQRALFHAAELLAALEERQTAIQLAEELVDQEEVETEVVYEALLTWLHADGNKADLARWLNKYRAWFAAAYPGRSLDTARPDFIARLNPGASSARF